MKEVAVSNSPNVFVITIGHMGDRHLARVCNKKDALLISTSPELLDSLEELSSRINYCFPDKSKLPQSVLNSLLKAKELIAKAKGELL